LDRGRFGRAEGRYAVRDPGPSPSADGPRVPVGAPGESRERGPAAGLGPAGRLGTPGPHAPNLRGPPRPLRHRCGRDRDQAQWLTDRTGGSPLHGRVTHRGSDPLRVDGPLATDLSRVHGRLRLEEQDVHLLIGDGTMLRSPWDHRELTLTKVDRTVRQVDPKATLQHVEEFVLPRMVVPDELALELHQFHVRIVQLGDDLRLPIVADSIQFRAKIHRRYWFLRFLRHPVASLFPRKRRTRLRIMKDWPRFRIVSLSASRPSGGGTA